MTELISKYLQYLKIERNASVHTINSYGNDLSQLLDFAAREFNKESRHVQVDEIDRLTIRLWLGELSENGMARNTIARKVASVRSFFKYCFKRGYIDKNPAHLLIVPKKEQRLPKTVRLTDIETMMNLADGDEPCQIQEKAILELFYSTGMRLSELTGLNVTDLDLNQRQITVFGKGSKQRTIPLGNKALDACSRHLQTRKKLLTSKSGPDAKTALFIAPEGGRMYPRKVQRIVKDYFLKVSEVTQKSPHTLRHSFATHMLDAGADIRMIKEFLGHANLASTQVYTHTSVERLKKVYSQAHPRAEK
jgi:integrase/recombinase XerC